MTEKDIINKNFSRAFRGYDPGEVDAFLDEIIREQERSARSIELLELRVKMLLEELDRRDIQLPEGFASAGAAGSNPKEEKEE